jgi:hypothetical protein
MNYNPRGEQAVTSGICKLKLFILRLGVFCGKFSLMVSNELLL